MARPAAQAAGTGVSGFCSGFLCLEEDGSEKAGALISPCPVVGAFTTLFFLCALSDDRSKHFPQLFPYPQSFSGLWSNWYPWGTEQSKARRRGEFSKGTSLSLYYFHASGRNVIPLRPLPICQTLNQPTGSKVIWGSNDWQNNCTALVFFLRKQAKKVQETWRVFFGLYAVCVACRMVCCYASTDLFLTWAMQSFCLHIK